MGEPALEAGHQLAVRGEFAGPFQHGARGAGAVGVQVDEERPGCRTGRGPGSGPEGAGQLLVGAQHAPGQGQQAVPVGGELDGTGGADEQRGRQCLFEAPDVPAQRLLGDVQAGGGPGEVQFLGNGDEPAQQPGFHITGIHPGD